MDYTFNNTVRIASAIMLRYLLISCIFVATGCSTKRKIICAYDAAWSCSNKYFEPEDIDINLCTHLMYVTVGIGDFAKVKLLNQSIELAESSGGNCLQRFTKIKYKNNNLKIILGVGWYLETDTIFSTIARNNTATQMFANNIRKFITRHDFDGIHLEWLWSVPNQDDFANLLKILNTLLQLDGLSLSVTAHVPQKLDASIATLSSHVDYIYVTSHFDVSIENETRVKYPLYPRLGENQYTSIDETVQYLLDKGIPSDKLVILVSTIGLQFTLTDKTKTFIGAPVIPALKKKIPYNKICQQLNNSIVVWDDQQKISYSYNATQWISFESIQSVQAKSQYVLDRNLGGVMVSCLACDDVYNVCGGGKYPLVSTVKKTLFGKNSHSLT